MKTFLFALYSLLWIVAFADLRQWKLQEFQTDTNTNEGNFFSFWVVGNVIFLFFYALRVFVRSYQ